MESVPEKMCREIQNKPFISKAIFR